jgi:hypothetical protein
MQLTPTDFDELKYAKRLLENPGLMARLMNRMSLPFQKAFKHLPDHVSKRIQDISEKSITSALDFAIESLDERTHGPSSDTLHRFMSISSGCIGGFFGLAGLALEVPVSTTIILRSIADIAGSQGENIMDIETKLACLEVFALGGKSSKDDTSETGYFAVRTALSKAVSDASRHIAKKGLTEEGAPVLLKLITLIAARFGIVISEKAAASAIPVIGAAGSGLVNMIFIDHFQDMAKGHFIVRRMERTYGKDLTRLQYECLRIDA